MHAPGDDQKTPRGDDTMRRAVILMYHIIDEPRAAREARFACPPERFAAQLRRLRDDRHTFVSLTDLAAGLSGKGALPPQPVAVTLDDGFEDACTRALPVLTDLGVPATVFVATGTIGDENAWMTARGFPARRMLDWSQVRALHAAGVTIGSHTVTHPRLSNIDNARVQAELRDSKAALEDALGAPVNEFAYPYGDCSPAVVEAVKATGYRIACTTRSGFNRPGIPLHELRRIEVYGADSPWRVAQKLRFGSNDSGVLKPALYYARRAAARLAGAP